jgi:hypothetical protein
MHRASDSDAKKEDAQITGESVRETLSTAVEEGIMYVVLRNEENEELKEGELQIRVRSRRLRSQ